MRKILLGLTAALALLTGPLATTSTAETSPHRIKAITYNVGDGTDDAKRQDLRRLMAKRPHVIGLQEVADREDLIRTVARNNGYRAIYETGAYAHHNAVLVRGDLAVDAHGLTKISDWADVNDNTPGARQHNGMHPPKYINWVRFRANGLTWVVGDVHLVPSAEKYALNKQLHNRQVAACARWFSSRVREPLLMGDFNAVPASTLMDGLKAVAKVWTRASHGTRAIDHHWSKKSASGTVAALGTTAGDPDYSSDHRPVWANLVVNR